MKYFSQKDNIWKPNSTCFPTCYAMAIWEIFAKLDKSPPDYQLDEFIIRFFKDNDKDLKQKGDVKSDLDAHTIWACYKPLKESLFHYLDFEQTFKKMSGKEIATHIVDSGLPVVVGTYLTHAGHIVTAVDVTPGGLICNDPYGNANTGYKDTNGEGVNYQFGKNKFPMENEKVYTLSFNL